MANAITHFLPLGQGRVPRRGEGVDKRSAHSCRNEVCDPSSASVKHKGEIKLCALCGLCVKNKTL